MFRPTVTVPYPEKKLNTSERFRGALVFDKDTCTACTLCIKACPTDCIDLAPAINPETKKRMAKISWYQIDFGKCNYCRLCEEACPTGPVKSVRHSSKYEWGISDRSEMIKKWTREEPENNV